MLATLASSAAAEPISRTLAVMVESLEEPDASNCGIRESDLQVRATLAASKAKWTISEDAYDYLYVSATAIHQKPSNSCAVSVTVAIKRSLSAPGGRILMGDTVSTSTLLVAPAAESGGDALRALEDLVKSAIAAAEERGM